MTSIKHDKDLLKGNALSFAALERVAVLQRDKQKANKQEWTMNQKLKQKTKNKNKNRPGQEQRILLCRTWARYCWPSHICQEVLFCSSHTWSDEISNWMGRTWNKWTNLILSNSAERKLSSKMNSQLDSLEAFPILVAELRVGAAERALWKHVWERNWKHFKHSFLTHIVSSYLLLLQTTHFPSSRHWPTPQEPLERKLGKEQSKQKETAI